MAGCSYPAKLYNLRDSSNKTDVRTSYCYWISFDHLNNTTRTRIDNHSTIVDDRITVRCCPVFCWNFVIRHTIAWQLSADGQWAIIDKRLPTLRDDILLKAWRVVAHDGTDNRTTNAAYNGTHRTADNRAADSARCCTSGSATLSTLWILSEGSGRSDC